MLLKAQIIHQRKHIVSIMNTLSATSTPTLHTLYINPLALEMDISILAHHLCKM